MYLSLEDTQAKAKTRMKIFIAIFVGMLSMGVILSLTYNPSKEIAIEKQSSKPIVDIEIINVEVLLKQFITRYAKSPKSVIFDPNFYDRIKLFKKNEYIAESYFDSVNLFNTELRTYYTAKIIKIDDVYSVQSFNIHK